MRQGEPATEPRESLEQIWHRASYWSSIVKEMFRGLASLPEHERARVERRIPTRMREHVEKATVVSWISGSVVQALNAAIASALGEPRLEEYFRAYTHVAATGSYFGQMHAAGLRIFGLGPHGLARNFALAHRMATRGFGRLTPELDSDTRTGVIRYVDMPRELLDHHYAVAARGSIRAMFEVMETTCAIAADESGLAAGQLSFHVQW